MTERRRYERGVSLVEVLVSVGVVAILATMAVKGLSGILERGQSTKCVGNLRQIVGAMHQYQTDNNGLYPAVRKLGPSVYWYMALAPYLDGALSPSGVGISTDVAASFICPSARKDFNAPSVKSIFRTYMASDLMRTVDSTGARSWEAGVRSVNIASPSTSIICIDGARTGSDYSCTSGQGWPAASPLISYRHGGTANALFFDGHVESIKPGSIKTEMWNAP